MNFGSPHILPNIYPGGSNRRNYPSVNQVGSVTIGKPFSVLSPGGTNMMPDVERLYISDEGYIDFHR